MGVRKKGTGPTGRVNNRLADEDNYRLMEWVDIHRDRIHRKMTYAEIAAPVLAELKLTVTRGNIFGVLSDFDLAVRPDVAAQATTRAGVERVKTQADRIALTNAERYRVQRWARDQRDRIDRKMTYEDMIAEVKEITGLDVGRGNLRSILRPLGLRAKKNFTSCPVGLSGQPDGEPDLSETTRGKSGAWKRAAQVARLRQRVEELAVRLGDLEVKPAGSLDQAAVTAAHKAIGLAEQLTQAQGATNDSLRGILARLKAVEERPAGVAGVAHNVVVGRVAKLEERAAARDKLVDHDLAQFQRTLADLLDRVRKLEGAVGGPEAVGS
jgi:hypothetical protein